MTKRRGAGKIRKQRPQGPRRNKRKGAESTNAGIRETVEGLVRKIQEDPALLQSFQKDPIRTVEQLLGVDLPDDKLQPLVSGVKAKLMSAGIGGRLEDLKKL